MGDSNADSSQQYVTFSLGEELFGVEVTRAREILSVTPVTKVPQTPEYLLGVINLRGQVVPVIDMRLKLGLPVGEETEDTCIIVVEVLVDGESIIVGALADAVREVLEIRSDQIEPAPRLGTRLKTEFITGMGKVDEQFLILLNIDRVFSSEELAIVLFHRRYYAMSGTSDLICAYCRKNVCPERCALGSGSLSRNRFGGLLCACCCRSIGTRRPAVHGRLQR